jgi:hypothetical protein
MISARIPVDVSMSTYVPVLDLFEKEIREDRNKRGDSVLIAFYQSQPVSYLFATTKDCWVGEVNDWLIVKPQEVYLYDAFTQPAYRGNHIYSTLISSAADFFRKKSYSYALIFTSTHNVSSTQGIERCGFDHYGTVHCFNFFGTHMWNFKTTSTYVKSHFKHQI